MNLKLHIIKRQDIPDYSKRHRFCFAVIDLSKSESYPANYVCALPAYIGRTKQSRFEELFGEKSAEQAKTLLSDALEGLKDSDIKGEIERRVELLELNNNHLKCCVCGGLFLAKSAKKFRKNYCEKCAKKKFGTRAWADH